MGCSHLNLAFPLFSSPRFVVELNIKYDASCLPYYESDLLTGDEDMRVWLACFFVLFALAEFFDWLQAFSLPLPIYILGGAFLAIASNYDKIIGSYFNDANIEASTGSTQLDSLNQSTGAIAFTIPHPVENPQPSDLT